MNITKMYSGRLWVVADLDGEDLTLTIRDVTRENLAREGEPPDFKAVVYFRESEAMCEGTDKGLGLNKTNAETIAMLWGGDTDAWTNKKITLFPDTTRFQGKATPCIRIRPTTPKGEKPSGVSPATTQAMGKEPF